MDITPLVKPELKMIQSYGAGFFRVNGVIFKTPIVVVGETVTLWASGSDPLILDDAVRDDVRALVGQVDMVLIGAGAQSRVLPPKQRAMLSAQMGCVIDVMDTPSACRTYNVLTAEGRRVAAALSLI